MLGTENDMAYSSRRSTRSSARPSRRVSAKRAPARRTASRRTASRKSTVRAQELRIVIEQRGETNTRPGAYKVETPALKAKF